jgi:hypothetical protein
MTHTCGVERGKLGPGWHHRGDVVFRCTTYACITYHPLFTDQSSYRVNENPWTREREAIQISNQAIIRHQASGIRHQTSSETWTGTSGNGLYTWQVWHSHHQVPSMRRLKACLLDRGIGTFKKSTLAYLQLSSLGLSPTHYVNRVNLNLV